MLFRSCWKYGIPAWMLIVVMGLPGAASPEQPGRLEAIAQRCSTPELLAAFLKEHVTFQEDRRLFGREDYWQEPEEFLDRSAGDCEDYALLAEAVLRGQGREAFVLSLYGEGGYAHTVCVFSEKRRYHVINQDRVVRYGARSLEELADRLYPRWTWGAVARRVGTRGQAVRRITPGSRPSSSGFRSYEQPEVSPQLKHL